MTERLTWAQFVREYRRELLMDGPTDSRSRTIKNHGQKFTLRLLKQIARKGNVTVMCHCAEDQLQCHRHTLKKQPSNGPDGKLATGATSTFIPPSLSLCSV